MHQEEQPNDAKKRKRLEKHENVKENMTCGNNFCSYFIPLLSLLRSATKENERHTI
jgi:hypothetical protein